MYVSRETADRTRQRLLGVVRQAEMRIYPEPYAFWELAHEDFPMRMAEDALAHVRDEHVWSALVPADSEGGAEMFQVFRFHFAPGIDNSGFIGWLASHLKARTGTGVFVICGQNSGRGGIFDYWGCPWHLRETVLGEIEQLRAGFSPE